LPTASGDPKDRLGAHECPNSNNSLSTSAKSSPNSCSTKPVSDKPSRRDPPSTSTVRVAVEPRSPSSRSLAWCRPSAVRPSGKNRRTNALAVMDRKQAPPGVEAPNLAVVGVDGGRLQIGNRSGEAVVVDEIDEGETVERGESGRHWREDTIGVVMTMNSDDHESDPCPDIPANFVDAARMTKLVRELGKSLPAGAEEAEKEVVKPRDREWQPPESTQKVMVASRRPWSEFGPMVAASAWQLGFYGATRKAFVGDGSSNNWTLWKDHFSSIVPILDFIHALTYVFTAAMAGLFGDNYLSPLGTIRIPHRNHSVVGAGSPLFAVDAAFALFAVSNR
jgi:hypothetical protein